MQPGACNLCEGPLGAPVYRSPQPFGVTSLCEVIEGFTEVFLCAQCGHVQTAPMARLDAYYEHAYKILTASEDEDQLYSLEQGRRVFRTEHQVNTLLGQVDLPRGARVLDFGCAKASTLRALCQRREDVEPHVFDVSDRYRPFWDRFVPPENQRTHDAGGDWRGQFDLVMSLFALEHVASPRDVLAQAVSLLRPGGVFYGIVPCLFSNRADLIVADHVNHFTGATLQWLCALAGLKMQSIADHLHAGAWMVIARREKTSPVEPQADAADATRVREIAEYWRGFSARVRAFEAAQDGAPVAIYGSGFYGTYIATSLCRPQAVECFLDQNPHRHSQTLMGKPILPPEQVPARVRALYVGLNPASARSAIQQVEALAASSCTVWYP